MADKNKLATMYIEIRAKADKLEADLNELKASMQSKAPKINFDTSLGKLKLDQLKNYHEKLKSVLENKIKMNMDVASIQRTQSQIDSIENTLKRTGTTVTETGDKLGRWATITTGINQGFELVRNTISQLKQEIGGSVIASANLDVLRDNFKGTADDIELFKKAVAGTVSEEGLIRLSNQATDLGLSLKQQAILFSLAEDAVDKYGPKAGTVEEVFNKIIAASEGSVKGVKSLGIETKKYQQKVDELATAQGDSITNLDAETQKQIRLRAIIELSGITIEDVKNKVKDNADQYESLSVAVEESKVKLGKLISDGLLPIIKSFDNSSKSVKDFMTMILATGGTVVDLIPLIGQLAFTISALKESGFNASTGMTALALSLGKVAIAFGSIYAAIVLANSVTPKWMTYESRTTAPKTNPDLKESTSTGFKFENTKARDKELNSRRDINKVYISEGKSVNELRKQLKELHDEQNRYKTGSPTHIEIENEKNQVKSALELLELKKKADDEDDKSGLSKKTLVSKTLLESEKKRIAEIGEDLKKLRSGSITIDDKNLIASLENEKKSILGIGNAQKENNKLLKDKKKIIEDFSNEYESFVNGGYEVERRNIQKSYNEYVKAGVDKNKADSWRFRKLNKLNDKYINEQADDSRKTTELSRKDYDEYRKSIQFKIDIENKLDTTYSGFMSRRPGYYSKDFTEYKAYLDKKIEEDKRLGVQPIPKAEAYYQMIKGSMETGNLPSLLQDEMKPVELPVEPVIKLEKWEEMMIQWEEDMFSKAEIIRTTISSISEGLTAGFDTFWEGIKMSEEESKNAIISGFVTMANVFISQVKRMIAEWISFQIIKGAINWLTGGIGGAIESVASAVAGHSGGTFENGQKIASFAGGGSFIVPLGFEHDSFPMMVESGERVSVTPRNAVSSNTGNTEDLLKQLIGSVQANTATVAKTRQVNLGDIYMDTEKVTKKIKGKENTLAKNGVNFNVLR